MSAVHLTPDDGIGYLTAADELEEAELGARAAWWLASEQLVRSYASKDDKLRGYLLYLAGSVASATTHRGRPFPPQWWPPDAGPYPEELS